MSNENADIDAPAPPPADEKPAKRAPQLSPYQWSPGTSGNPGGRAKGLEKRVRELVGERMDDIILAMRDIATNRGFKAADRIAAAKLLWDRGWGQARQSIDVKSESTVITAKIDPSRLTPDQARAFEESLSAMLDPGDRDYIEVTDPPHAPALEALKTDPEEP